jgi:2-haloalkanoic acid dehalogenase type II
VSVLVTFDLFSALLDTRSGAAPVLGALAREHGWDLDGGELYDRWDRHNKASQRDTEQWVPFAEHCRRALTATYLELRRAADADVDTGHLLATAGDWPLWPDVAEQLPRLAERTRVGVLSNVDDALFARTQVGAFVGRGIADADVLTSERLRAYKPAPELYRRARERAGGQLVHVATSGRDVRGALEAGLTVVRLRRPGHGVDPDGPAPAHEAGDLAELEGVLAALPG